MKSTALAVLSLFVSLLGFSQKYQLDGKVIDSKNQPVGYAEIRLFQNSDSAIVDGMLTQEDGTFQFELNPGDYWMSIEFIDFATDTVAFTMPASKMSLPNIVLKPGAQALEGVTVIGQRSPLEFQIDKRVYNVSADLNNQGVSAAEMLENIPSVTVDAEGNVSLRGNQGVRILVDGKYSGYASSAEGLKQLQADRIERVEIITNASSRYDAEGDAGIINIVLKKEKRDGVSGSVNARLGYFPEYGAGADFNYRKGKWNFSLNYNINHHTNPSNSSTYQRLHTSDTAFAYRQLYKSERKKLRNNISLGADYNINDFHQLSATFNYRTGLGDNFYDRVYENLNESDIILSKDTRYEYNTELEDMYEITLGYRMKFKKEGGSWNTEFRYFKDQDLEASNFSEINSLLVDSQYEKSKAYVTQHYFLAQSDFIIPFGEQGKIETGVRTQLRNYDNEFGFQEMILDEWIAPAAWNDIFEYNEQVHAGYLMASNQWDKFGAQAGLRTEYTVVETIRQSEGISNKKNYNNLFPSVALSYKLNDNHTFQLSYSKRIRRPGQWELMPFLRFGDNKEMMVGNPDLNPELTHSLEAGWMQYFTRGSLLTSVYYRHTDEKIERMSEVGSDGIIYRIPLNIADRNSIGLELNANYNPVNWLRISTGFNFYKENIYGYYKDEEFERDNFSWSNRTTANFIFPGQWRAQIAGNYEAPRIHPQGKILSIAWADIGMSKDIWSQKATLGFNVRDVFNSRVWRSETHTDEITANTDFQWRPRSFRLVFTYRFNQQLKDRRPEMPLDGGQMEMEG